MIKFSCVIHVVCSSSGVHTELLQRSKNNFLDLEVCLRATVADLMS